MDSAGLRWYRTGTVNITQGSTNITGVGTNWQTAGIQPGDVFMVGNSVLYEIAQVADNTNIVLNSAFQGATGTAQNYSIIRNFAGTMQAQIAAQVSELVNKYESYIDTELQQIVGPPGPTSFPYRGTWATGREYDALDVVEYSRLLYMAVAGHVSTSENAPGAANTEWMPLQVASGAVTTTFTNGAAITPNGDYGVSIAGNAPNKNILTNITPTGITIQSEESGGTTTQATFMPENDTGWINPVADVAIRKINKIVFVNVYKRMEFELPYFQSYPIFVIPSGFAPSNSGVAVSGPGIIDRYDASGKMQMVQVLIQDNTFKVFNRIEDIGMGGHYVIFSIQYLAQ